MAEALLLAGYEGLKSRERRLPAYAKVKITDAIQNLVDHYTALDRPADAEKWRLLLPAETP